MSLVSKMKLILVKNPVIIKTRYFPSRRVFIIVVVLIVIVAVVVWKVKAQNTKTNDNTLTSEKTLTANVDSGETDVETTNTGKKKVGVIVAVAATFSLLCVLGLILFKSKPFIGQYSRLMDDPTIKKHRNELDAIWAHSLGHLPLSVNRNTIQSLSSSKRKSQKSLVSVNNIQKFKCLPAAFAQMDNMLQKGELLGGSELYSKTDKMITNFKESARMVHDDLLNGKKSKFYDIVATAFHNDEDWPSDQHAINSLLDSQVTSDARNFETRSLLLGVAGLKKAKDQNNGDLMEITNAYGWLLTHYKDVVVDIVTLRKHIIGNKVTVERIPHTLDPYGLLSKAGSKYRVVTLANMKEMSEDGKSFGSHVQYIFNDKDPFKRIPEGKHSIDILQPDTRWI
mgnify:FL=1